MAFCGQCGLLLPPKVASCPRCDSLIAPRWELVDQTQNAGNATNPKTYIIQQPEDFAGDNGETSKIEQSEPISMPLAMQNAPLPSYTIQPPMAPPPPSGYTTQIGSGFFSTQGAPPYPDANFATQGVPYPASLSPLDPGNLPGLVSSQKTNEGRMLLVTFLLFLLVAVMTAAVIIGPNRVLQMVRGGRVISQTTPALLSSEVPTLIVPTPTTSLSPTPEQQAQSVIDRYYTAINSKDYQTAYNLWINNPESYQKFANGFADTSHDDYTFGSILPQRDGSVQLYISLSAVSTTSQQSTYKGYFIVGQQLDGSWKITSARIHKV